MVLEAGALSRRAGGDASVLPLCPIHSVTRRMDLLIQGSRYCVALVCIAVKVERCTIAKFLLIIYRARIKVCIGLDFSSTDASDPCGICL